MFGLQLGEMGDSVSALVDGPPAGALTNDAKTAVLTDDAGVKVLEPG
jgi:hypothetical protein